MAYEASNPVRVVTAASLFDGHDATINIIRRILQDFGVEVIHLGHNRSVSEVVSAALQEGAQGICISSYQGGHMEYFKYCRDLLDSVGCQHVKIFGGGGGVIVHEEKAELEAYGISKIFHPDDGRKLGLEGMIEIIVRECDYAVPEVVEPDSAKVLEGREGLPEKDLGLALTNIELNGSAGSYDDLLTSFKRSDGKTPMVLGITGTGGAGKSSLIDELLHRFLNFYPGLKIGVLCVDPSKRKTGGALLGDRIRMNALSRQGVFMRSVASRGSGNEISEALPPMLDYMKSLQFDLLIAESSGIGQASSKILEVSDKSLYVMTSEFGAQSQLEKIDMIDFADLIAINKADRRGAADAFRDVQKQYRRSKKLFDDSVAVPVYLTQASNFNDAGLNGLFKGIVSVLKENSDSFDWSGADDKLPALMGTDKRTIVPPERQSYLAEITSCVRGYKKVTAELASKASDLGALKQVANVLSESVVADKVKELEGEMPEADLKSLANFEELRSQYSGEEFVYSVRGKEIKQPLTNKSLCGLQIPRVVVPSISDWGDRLRYLRLENVPGEFPYTAGVFPLKRQGEDPIRQFAGEGPPQRTNKRFHYLSEGDPAKRLSTAFDSVTLYGGDPDPRPDIFGKVGESGVSICTLDDMKALYNGFDLCDPSTSVSMTINGPAPMILAFFMNTAIDQQVEKQKSELGRDLNADELAQIKNKTLQTVRGTVQADILKEDQGQNTCIFSTDFALKLMGDIQEYFTHNQVRNFYSVSISGYHIAEAGANPITQLALTLSNAFTYVEYYLSRGLKVDEFAPNLSFFFSNGMDPEYSVIGRVARRIWAIAMRDLYGANERSQKLKYHIQTSGRSLHAQEIDFNDIRTTLQALLAIYDNCNSLHTNAYDEAITTPTEESVRRAKAIQMIITKEFGMAKNENPNQGSFYIDWLTEAVEEAVLDQFMKLNERGGVLGAMETQYQRSQIQEESLYYEMQKHDGSLPIVGVNTFINPETLEEGYQPPKIELARASQEEKQSRLEDLRGYQGARQSDAEAAVSNLKAAALAGENIFASLMDAARVCSLNQMTTALYEVGGQYRRNL
ncbi:MAG: cobalamin B12-binding domain-containing protein [Bdellovibrionales bacterium]|nr:cobalamin B12-binding domain-containing protein [Bdellovibrionales bacterium]